MLVVPKKNSKGIILMIISMASFAVGDTFVKISGTFLSPAQIMFFLIAGGLIIFAIIAKFKGENLLDSRAFSPVLLIRYLAEMIGLVAMIMGLTKIPLSVVGTVTQASPILVAAGAVLFFKENVSWRRWSSIVMGFIGVVLVIQPGSQNLDYAVIWAVVALVAFSIRDLVTRLTPPDIPSASIATFTMIAAFPFTAGWVFFGGEKFFPPEIDWVVVASMIILGSFGYLLLITSLRLGELSAIMPFRYSRIVFLLILGVLVFGERPTASMLVGAALILTSGVYIMWREKVVKSGLIKTHT
jgi:drug/metabolite transporter (DMT)-like permease